MNMNYLGSSYIEANEAPASVNLL